MNSMLSDEARIKKPDRYLTKYTAEDINERIKRNGTKLSYVHYFLIDFLGPGFPIIDLMSLAVDISRGLGIYLDRMAKRNKKALICWFTENWSVIYPRIGDFHTKANMNQQITLEQQKSDQYSSDIFKLLNHN